MPYKNLLLNIHSNGIADIILNRPDAANAIDDQLIHELHIALEQLAQDPQVKLITLSGQGKHFSAGADARWMQRMRHYSTDENYQDALKLANLLELLNTIGKPTLAIIQGAAYGGALGLIACCDIAIAASDAQFCFSEVKLGLVPAVISPYIIAAIGMRNTRRYFLTAEVFDSAAAYAMGLIHSSVPSTQLAATRKNFESLLLQNSPIALTKAKQLLNTVQNQPVNQAIIQYTAQAIAEIRTSRQGQEGLKAFLEKRKPNWE